MYWSLALSLISDLEVVLIALVILFDSLECQNLKINTNYLQQFFPDYVTSIKQLSISENGVNTVLFFSDHPVFYRVYQIDLRSCQ